MKNENKYIINNILMLIKPYSKRFIIFFFAILFQASISVLFPFIFSYLINEVYYNKNINVLGSIISIYLVLFIFRSILNLLETYIKSNMLTDFLLDVRVKMFNSIILLKSKYLQNVNIGEEIMKLNNDTEHIFYFIYGIFYNITDAIKLLLTLIIIYKMNSMLFTIILFIVPIIVFLSDKFGSKISKQIMKYRKECGRLSGWIFEIIDGIRDIRLMSAHKSIIELYKDKINQINNKKMKININSVIIDRIIKFADLLGTLIIYIVSVLLIGAKKLSIGNFLAVIDYFGNAKGLLGSLASSHLTLCKDFEYIKSIFNSIDEYSGNGETFINLQNIKISKAEIEFSNISFGYDNREKVLDKINFKIEPGQTIAIVGKNGSGKSSLMSLLMRFYEPNEGKISIDSLNINNIPLNYLRKYCGIVLQDYTIFNGSIKYNLQIANDECTQEELFEACKRVGLYDYIYSLPDKMDTIIGADGINLSGGQRQRLCIARILLKNPDIIIFDEATSALDTETEKIIMQTVDYYRNKKTIIFITHNLSIAQMYDRVLLIDCGKVVDFDNHTESLITSNIYNNTFENQENNK